MQQKTSYLAETSKSVGLKIHPGKTKVMKINTRVDTPILVEDKTLEVVNQFTYLGSVVDETGGTMADTKVRIGKARSAFNNLQKVWKDRSITTKTKIRLFNSNVKSVLLYGCETWSPNTTCTN